MDGSEKYELFFLVGLFSAYQRGCVSGDGCAPECLKQFKGRDVMIYLGQLGISEECRDFGGCAVCRLLVSRLYWMHRALANSTEVHYESCYALVLFVSHVVSVVPFLVSVQLTFCCFFH